MNDLIKFEEGSAWFSFQFIPYDKKYLARPFAIITAYNPNMKNCNRTPEDNALANERLSLLLKNEGYYFLPSVGELSGYSEESYIVYDISRSKALAIGKQFQQESIVYNDGKIIAVVDCKTSENVIELNHFKKYCLEFQ